MSIIPLATVKQETRKGDKDVLPYLIEDLDFIKTSPRPSLHETLLECFRQRAEKVGIKHYKTPLQTNNGHDPLVDAFQEVLDSVMYLAQDCIEERWDDPSLEFQAIQLLMAIAAKLEAKYGTDSL